MGLVVGDLAFDAGQRVQPLASEPFGEQGQESRNGGPAGELVVGGAQEPLDRLNAEGVGELGLQPGGRGAQRKLLVDRQVAAGVSDRTVGHGVLPWSTVAGSSTADDESEDMVLPVKWRRRASET